MALKLGKDIKKSSYYVWFLGAKESKGLRGADHILQALRHLEQREQAVEPFKVTLQVSHKGVKIIQNVTAFATGQPSPSSTTNTHKSGSSKGESHGNGNGSAPAKLKSETIKHFIAHNTITCVHQSDDVVGCILLLFNPVTKCPLHVHGYRCDSLETAALLRRQLQMLIERPENQKKFAEIENRLLLASGAGSAGNGCNRKERVAEEPSCVDAHARRKLTPVLNTAEGGASSLGGGSSDADTGTWTRESQSSEESLRLAGRFPYMYDSVAAELKAKLGAGAKGAKGNEPLLLPPRDYDTVHRQKGNLTGIELRRCLNSSIVGQQSPTSPASGILLESQRKAGATTRTGKRLESSGGSSGIGSDHHPDSPVGETADSPGFSEVVDANESGTSDGEEWCTNYAVTSHHLFSPNKSRQKDHNKQGAPSNKHQDHMLSKSTKKPTTGKLADRTTKPVTERNYRKSLQEDDVGFEDYNQQQVGMQHQMQYRNNSTAAYEDDANNRRKGLYRRRYQEVPTEPNTSPRERFQDAKEKFLLLERERERVELIQRTARMRLEEQPISPVRKEAPQFVRRHESFSRFNQEMRPKPAPRNMAKSPEQEAYHRYEQMEPPMLRCRDEKYDLKRRSMYNLIEEEHRKNSSEIARELKRRSYMETSAVQQQQQQQKAPPSDGYYHVRQQQQHTFGGGMYAGSRDEKEKDYDYSTLAKDQFLQGKQNPYSKSSLELNRMEHFDVNHHHNQHSPRAYPSGGGNNNSMMIAGPLHARKNLHAGHRHSYVEPKLYNGASSTANAQRIAEMLHRTNSTVSTSGRVGIASIHPY